MRLRVFFIFAVVFALLLYSTGFFAPLMLDDPNVLQVAQHFGWSTRALGYFSFWLNQEMLPVIAPLFPWHQPFYFRFVNVLIHACAATALCWVAFELIGEWLPASVAGALFLVHPIQTQGVTYISQRFESMAAMFMFLAAGAYIKFRKAGRMSWLAATLFFAVAAATTKETAVMLPLWLMFVEFVFFDRKRLRRIAVYMGLIGLVLVYPAWRAFSGGSGEKTFGWIPWHEYFLNQGPILTKYFQLSLWPRRQFLFYDYHLVTGMTGPVILQWLLVLGVIGLGFYLLRRDRVIGFGILTFFILLIPVIVLPLPDLIMEHRLYPAYAGVALAGAGLFRKFNGPASRRIALGACGILLILYSVKTERRNADWNDQIRFMELHLEAFPHNTQVLERLAAYYYLSGRVNKALEFNLEARKYEDQLNPYYLQQGHLLSGVNLSYIYLAKRDYPAAKTEALRAIAAKPEDSNGWSCLGQVEEAMGNNKAAEAAFQRQAELAQDSQSWLSLKEAAVRAGDQDMVNRAEAALKKREAEETAGHPRQLPSIPEKYRTYVVFGLTLGLLSAVLWAARTVWSAIRAALTENVDSSPIVVDSALDK